MDGTSDQVQTLTGVAATWGRDHASTHNGRQCSTGHRAGSGRTARDPGGRSGALVACGRNRAGQPPRPDVRAERHLVRRRGRRGRHHAVLPPSARRALLRHHRCRHRGRARAAEAHSYRAAVLRIAGNAGGIRTVRRGVRRHRQAVRDARTWRRSGPPRGIARGRAARRHRDSRQAVAGDVRAGGGHRRVRTVGQPRRRPPGQQSARPAVNTIGPA